MNILIYSPVNQLHIIHPVYPASILAARLVPPEPSLGPPSCWLLHQVITVMCFKNSDSVKIQEPRHSIMRGYRQEADAPPGWIGGAAQSSDPSLYHQPERYVTAHLPLFNPPPVNVNVDTPLSAAARKRDEPQQKLITVYQLQRGATI